MISRVFVSNFGPLLISFLLFQVELLKVSEMRKEGRTSILEDRKGIGWFVGIIFSDSLSISSEPEGDFLCYTQVFVYSLATKKLSSICPAILHCSLRIFTFAKTSLRCDNICLRKTKSVKMSGL